jgi:lysyl-tRNA synthetase class 2
MQALMQEVAELIQSIFASYSQTAPFLPVSYTTYQALFQKHLEFDPLLITVDELKAIVRSGLPVEIIVSDAQWLEYDKDDWLNWLLGNYIEPKLGQDELCFVVDYPVSQASLAKQSPQDSRVAKRFECYYQGIELCNGFEELTDSTEQRQRFQQENAQRAAMGLAEMPIDDRLLAALPSMPSCSGVAVGIDRMIMLALGQSELAEVMSFTSYNA